MIPTSYFTADWKPCAQDRVLTVMQYCRRLEVVGERSKVRGYRLPQNKCLFMMPESVVLHTDPQLQFLHHVSVDDFCVGSRAALAGDMTVSSERASLASKSWSEAIPKRLRRKTAAELRRAYRPAPPQLSRVISWSLVVKLEAVKNIGYEQWCNRCVSEQYDSRANSSCVTLKHLFVSG
uniref:CABIT domain-containing protein n=1 Tax=Ascaris lumbricoides TaxID=6252 RepID=A0A0M3HQH2_ASCLU